jgi:glutamate synthase domain-containing protein 1
MSDCPASSQSNTGMKKTMMPELFRYRTKPTQSSIFFVRYRTVLMDDANADAGVSFLDADGNMEIRKYIYNFAPP